jgi:proline iminopeptidase
MHILFDRTGERRRSVEKSGNPKGLNHENQIIEKIHVNGVDIHVEINHTEGIPLVLLHGGPGFSHRYLNPHFALCMKEYKLVMYDQRAAGKSTGREKTDELTVDNYLIDLEEVLNHYEIGKVVLLGHSWGALLAMLFAIRFPDRVKALVLSDPAPASSRYVDLFEEEIIKRLTKAEKQRIREIYSMKAFQAGDIHMVNTYFHIILRPYFYQPEKQELLNLGLDREGCLNVIATEKYFKYIHYFDIENELGRISCPSLMITGKHDAMPIEERDHLNRSLLNSKWVVLENSAHFGFIEESDQFFSEVKEFLRNVLQ